MGNEERFSDSAEENVEGSGSYYPERRLWTAVLLQAVEDWRSNNMRAYEAANAFLFHGGEDFDRVCQGAGFEPSALQSKLRRLCVIGPMARRRELYLPA